MENWHKFTFYHTNGTEIIHADDENVSMLSMVRVERYFSICVSMVSTCNIDAFLYV